MLKFQKLKKALAVCKDLDSLEFRFNNHGYDNKLYSIRHPLDRYSIWTANGFWFCALYKINGTHVDGKPISKFGAIGKVLVWWKCQKQISRFHKKEKECVKENEKELLEVILGKGKELK